MHRTALSKISQPIDSCSISETAPLYVQTLERRIQNLAELLANSTHFDLIFMDMQMPRLDCLEATRRIRQHEHEMQKISVPIIGLSGYATGASRQSALEAGMNDYLTKPFIRTELNAKLAYWLYQVPADTIEPETNPIGTALPFFSSSPKAFLEERFDSQNIVISTRH